MTIPSEILIAAQQAASTIPADVFIYNGPLKGGNDLVCIEAIQKSKRHNSASLFLTTNGGEPDAGYKIARYFQDKYENFSVVISGRCKSAGTLVAIGANELVFTPYGELGPLDIQLSKVDKFGHMESGLTIQDSLDSLQRRAVQEYMTMVQSYMQANNGLLSFAAATDAAAKMITGLYGPVFARIDPEEVGARARSMRIAIDYGKRLVVRSQNLAGPDTLRTLAETYPSHSFVIDQQEASLLFRRVRAASDGEAAVVAALGPFARFEMAPSSEVHFHALSGGAATDAGKGADDDGTRRDGSTAPDVTHPTGAGGASVIPWSGSEGAIPIPDADAAATRTGADGAIRSR